MGSIPFSFEFFSFFIFGMALNGISQAYVVARLQRERAGYTNQIGTENNDIKLSLFSQED